MKKIKQRILSSFLALCIIATIVPSFGITVGATIAENEAIYSVNQNTDGMTDNIIVASYNDVSYVMGDIDENGIAEAIPAVKSGDYGNNIVINETSANLFKVTTEIYRYSGGSYWLYRMITEDGYIVDNYGNDYENHKLTTMDKATVDASETKPYYDWRFDWSQGWYNRDSSYSIYLVADGADVYFKLGDGSSAEGEEYIAVDIFSKSCQHTNMQYVPAVSPTCKQDGCGAYWYCPDCDANCSAPYFSDEDGLNGEFNPPVTMSYGAIDTNNDGICDDCGKNMPVFKKVTDDSQIVDGGKYIFVTKVGDKYYAAATGTEIYGNQLPAVEITPDTNGNFTFEGTTDAMSVEIRFANACTEWGSGIRYGFITRFNQKRSEFAPSYDGEFYFDEYDIRGAKYGFYMGLNSDGTARIHSAYDESSLIHSYTNDEGQQFTFVDQSLDESYTETPVYLYRLTDIGTVNSNSYEMTAVKSETDYSIYQEGVVDAEGGTNIIGVTDALTQTAINNIVQTFVTDNSISDGENVHINTGVNIAVTDYSAENSITFSLNPTAVVTSNETGQAYNILDSDFDGTTPMTVTLYTGEIYPAQIIHQKQDGTKEYFYPEYSEMVLTGAEKPFYELYDQSGNMYVTFTVTEYSDIKLLTEPMYDYDEVTPERPAGVEIVDNQEVFLYFTPAESGFYRIYDTNRSDELNVPCFNLYDSSMNFLCSSNNDNYLEYDFVGGTTYIIGTNFCAMGESWNGTYNVEVVKLVEPESINITTDTITGYEGCSEQLSVEYNPENSIQSSLIWNSSDTSVATVNDDGLLTLVAPGTATVTAATDSGLSDCVNVTVLELVEISLDETKNGTVDPAIGVSKFKFTPATDGIYQIEVRCNEFVSTEITDSYGNYLNRQIGYNYYFNQELEAEKTYYINTTNFEPSNNGYSFEYSISVKKLVTATSIKICNYSSLSVYTGESQFLGVIFDPENAATESVTWSSSNENVATVNYAGFVQFISAGTATITATSENGL
ncbi:MAG: Ig-like domain-containing protein, partial [Acutalibacteraceae bacterium]